MKFTILTLFPEMFAPLQESILKRAQETGSIQVKLVNFRDYARSKHKNVDDIPYGGGTGMVLKPEPIYEALSAFRQDATAVPLEGGKAATKRRIILLSPQGQVLTQKTAVRLAQYDELVLLCGHYEGFDERIRTWVDEEISLGDFVLTGGELAAMAVVDAVARLVPGVLGKAFSAEQDSHSDGLLEYPQYTRPPLFEGMAVPDILLSGHHEKIQTWRRKESLRRTFLRRPDLIPQVVFQATDYPLLEELVEEYPEISVYREQWQDLKPEPRRKRRTRSADTAL